MNTHRTHTQIHVVLVLIAVVGVFYWSTIRTGHDWGDDFALYISHAKNVIEGREYGSTGFLNNPLRTEYSPAAYPPVFPVLLAPVYFWRGLDFDAMKVVVILFFLAFLFVFYLTARDQLPVEYAIGLMLLIGFNPYFWNFKDSILAEFPFLFFVYTALYFIQRHYDIPLSERSSLGLPRIILVALFIYLAVGSRTVGIALLPSLMMHDVIRSRRVSSFAMMPGILAVTLIGAQRLLVPAGQGYLAVYQAHLDQNILMFVFSHIISFGSELPTIWSNGYSKFIRNGVFLIITALAVIGLLRRVNQRLTIYECFFFIYLLAVLLFPLPIFRYLMPIFPLYFLYAAVGLHEVCGFSKRIGWKHAPITLAVVIAMSYAFSYSTMDYGPIRVGVSKPESLELFQYIREHTQPDDIIICRKPRAMALLTGRRASILTPSPDIEAGHRIAWEYIHDIGATYLILDTYRNAQGTRESIEIGWLLGFVEAYIERFEEVFSNEDFTVYLIHAQRA